MIIEDGGYESPGERIILEEKARQERKLNRWKKIAGFFFPTTVNELEKQIRIANIQKETIAHELIHRRTPQIHYVQKPVVVRDEQLDQWLARNRERIIECGIEAPPDLPEQPE